LRRAAPRPAQPARRPPPPALLPRSATPDDVPPASTPPLPTTPASPSRRFWRPPCEPALRGAPPAARPPANDSYAGSRSIDEMKAAGLSLDVVAYGAPPGLHAVTLGSRGEAP